MPGAGLTVLADGQARPDRLALKPYWGEPTVRNFREGDGNVGIIRSPVRAIALPDLCGPRRSHGQPGKDTERAGVDTVDYDTTLANVTTHSGSAERDVGRR
jgi:hypothetical protein